MVRNTVLISITLLLQGIWEYVVCGTFYNTEVIDNMTLLMIQATIGDVGITLLIFNFLLLINRNLRWKMDVKDLSIIVLYSFAAAAFFESRALWVNRWSYSEDMSYFIGSGIGLIPVLQLVLLLPISISIETILTSKIMKS